MPTSVIACPVRLLALFPPPPSAPPILLRKPSFLVGLKCLWRQTLVLWSAKNLKKKKNLNEPRCTCAASHHRRHHVAVHLPPSTPWPRLFLAVRTGEREFHGQARAGCRTPDLAVCRVANATLCPRGKGGMGWEWIVYFCQLLFYKHHVGRRLVTYPGEVWPPLDDMLWSCLPPVTGW